MSQFRHVMPTAGYLSQRELTLTVGLGDHARVEQIAVTWPDGTIQLLEDVAADQLLRIVQDAP